MIKRHLIYITILWIGIALQAAPHLTRNYAYRYLSFRDGMSNMQVTCMFQDKDGYLWIGSKGSVMRYDGINFVDYMSLDERFLGDVFSIDEFGYNKVFFQLYEMWIMNEKGDFRQINYPDSLKSSGSNKINSFEVNSHQFAVLNLQNKKFYGTCDNSYQHFLYDTITGKFTKIHGFNKLVLDVRNNFLLASNGIYRINGYKIHQIFKTQDKYDYAEIDKGNNFYFNNKLTNAIEHYIISNGKVILNGNYTFNIPRSRPTFKILPDKRIVVIQDNQPVLIPNSGVGFGIKIPQFTYIFTDKENNLWIGTDNGIYNYFNLNFEEYRFGLSDPDNIWSINQSNNGDMWFGSYGSGLWRLNKKDELIAENRQSDCWGNQYMGASRSKSGDLFFPHCNGISVYKNGKFLPDKWTGTSIYTFYDEQEQQIYYSGIDSLGKKGLNVGIGENRKFYSWNEGFIISMAKDAHQQLRLGTWFASGRFVNGRLLVDSGNKSYQGVVSMDIDNKGRLWKGTTKGVYVEYPDGKEYRVLPKYFSDIGFVKVWQNKYLILSSNYGLGIAKLVDDLGQLKMIDIGYESGFTGSVATQNGVFEDNESNVWVCCPEFVMKFHPEKLFNDYFSVIPPIRVSSIFISKDNYSWEQSILNKGYHRQFHIDNSYKFFRIHYIANSISSPQTLIFRYRLKGFNNNWSESVSDKTVSYTNLPYGKFTFEVMCSLDGEKWSEVAQSEVIEIIRPLYLRPVFIVIYFILLIALIIHLTKVLLKRKEKMKLEVLNRKKLENELHLKTLRSKIIPHFTNNILTAIGHFSMTDKIKAGYYISVFSKFTGLTLANADKNYVNLSGEIEYIQKYLELEKMRFGDKFEFEIKVGNDVSSSTQLPAMTLHTYCDNAIRHGIVNKTGKGKVTIVVNKYPEGILISIFDNGIGRTQANVLGTHGNGKGLKLVEEQISFYNQANEHKMKQTITDLKDNDGKAAGTRVDLFIPDGFVFD